MPAMSSTYDAISTSETKTWDYKTLYYSFWPEEEYRDGPVIAAAGLADTSKLSSLLDRAELLDQDDYLFCAVDQPHDFKSISPILRSIERQRLENVRLLLDRGANPDGVPVARQKDLARRFRRVCHVRRTDLHDMVVGVAGEEVGTVELQTIPPHLTDDELAERRIKLAPFWAVADCIGIDYSMSEALYHSVVMAGLSTPAILDEILEADADSSAWRASVMVPLLSEDELSPSQLSISTPLHAAIAANKLETLEALLDRGFSPDARAIITGSQALTPTQYAIVIGNVDTYSLLEA